MCNTCKFKKHQLNKSSNEDRKVVEGGFYGERRERNKGEAVNQLVV